MTTPMQAPLEPYAIRMVNDPASSVQHWLYLANGRGSGIQAWVPEASLTLMVTWRCTVEKTVSIYLENTAGGRRPVYVSPVTTSAQATVMHIVPKPGETIRARPSTIGSGNDAELVITVIPVPFSE